MNSNKCIACGSFGVQNKLNGLNYYVCPKCNLLWRTDFTLPHGHYEEKNSGITENKKNRRERNSTDRLKTMGNHADFNDLCDVGTGDGITLITASKLGYKNLVGIEPADYVNTISLKDDVRIVTGTDKDLKKIMNEFKLKNISMFHVIEHLNNPLESLGLFYDACPTGGYLIIETPNSESYSLKSTKYKHDLVYEEHFFLFNKKNLNDILQNVGFKIIKNGQRDFDGRHLNRNEIMFRLGLKRFNHNRNRMFFENTHENMAKNKAQKPNIIKGIISEIFSYLGYTLINLLRRQDYIWVVARKT